MIGSIGSTAFPPSAGLPGGTGGLEAQLEQYRKQLADCIDCASAKTPEGQARIEEISGKMAAIKARLERVTASGAATQLDAAANATHNPAQISASATLGVNLNIYA